MSIIRGTYFLTTSKYLINFSQNSTNKYFPENLLRFPTFTVIKTRAFIYCFEHFMPENGISIRTNLKLTFQIFANST
jgi:hypothetical protein